MNQFFTDEWACLRAPTIAHTITEQHYAAERWRLDGHPGAWAGLCDWLMEECLLTLEARNDLD